MDGQAPMDFGTLDIKLNEVVARLGHAEATQAACAVKWTQFDELRADVRAIREVLAPRPVEGNEPKHSAAPIVIYLGAKAGWIAAVISAVLAALGFSGIGG